MLDQAAFALRPPSPPCRLCSLVNHSATNDHCVPAEGEESFTLNITWLCCCGDKLRSGPLARVIVVFKALSVITLLPRGYMDSVSTHRQ